MENCLYCATQIAPTGDVSAVWIEYNPNPTARRVGDCAVRAVAVALGLNWESAYALLTAIGFAMGDMPSSNAVTGAALRQHGFKRANIPNECPDCFTVKEFAEQNPKGAFVLGTGTHVVGVVDGRYMDSWDSGDESPVYVWYKDVNPVFDT